MKIVGKTEKDSFIISANQKEIEILMRFKPLKFEIGTEINIYHLYSQLNQIDENIKEISDSLEMASKRLRLQFPVFVGGTDK